MKKNTIKMNSKYKMKIINRKISTKKIYFYCFLFFLISLINFLLYNYTLRKIKLNNNSFKSSGNNKTKLFNKQNSHLDYNKTKFAIIKRTSCSICGLFSYYIVYLGCINNFISLGFIPIVDLESFPNIFNKLNASLIAENPWELYFNQPFGYTLNNVKKNAKNIEYFECTALNNMPNSDIFFNNIKLDYWHRLSNAYIPIKNNLLNEAENIINKLFKYSKNILGIFIRGTDYIEKKPKGHPIQPTSQMVINDVKEFNKKNNYDYYFISTEDDNIRKIFIKEFENKLKYLIFTENIDYDYKNKDYLLYNKNILGNLQYSKIYLLNMIILSKCIDIISSRTSGSIGIFIFKNGFRFSKVYDLGNY